MGHGRHQEENIDWNRELLQGNSTLRFFLNLFDLFNEICQFPLRFVNCDRRRTFSDSPQNGTGSMVVFLRLLKTDSSDLRIDRFRNREVLPMIVAQGQMEVTPTFRCSQFLREKSWNFDAAPKQFSFSQTGFSC
jgi:hypothetical protein